MRKGSVIALTLSLVVLAGGAAAGASSGGLTSKIDRARRDKAGAEEALQQAEQTLAAMQAEYDRAWRVLELATRDLLGAYEARGALEAQLETARVQLDQRAAAAYEAGPAFTIELFLGSRTLSDFSSAQEYAARVFSVSEEDIAQLAESRASLQAATASLERRQAELVEARADLDRLAAAIASEVDVARGAARDAGRRLDRLERQQRDLLARQRAADALLVNTGVGPGCDTGPVHDLIVQAFTPMGPDQVDYALFIATRESHCRPDAYNPIYVPPWGNASGVFQILYPGIWDAWSRRCGYEGADPFDAVANVNVAACVVQDQGWWPWNP